MQNLNHVTSFHGDGTDISDHSHIYLSITSDSLKSAEFRITILDIK